MKGMNLKNKLGIFFFGLLKQDNDNPYVYICKKCGQSFGTEGYGGTYHFDRLFREGVRINPNCNCLKIETRNKNLFKDIYGY